jgi:hypothetical protein
MAQIVDPLTPPGPPSTRSATKKAFDRVMKDVLGFDDDDLLMKALDGDGFDSLHDVLTLTDDQIDALAYEEEEGVLRCPPLASRNKLRILRSWGFHLQSVQVTRRVNWMDQFTVNSDEWDEYRVAIYVPAGMPSTPTTPPVGISINNTPPSAPRLAPTANPASDFRRGNKRDKSHYTELKDEKQWDEFKRTTMATVYAHGCENVINPSFVPGTADEIALFEEQRRFMYDVWTTIFKTPMGKHFVRLHEGTRDAQAVWRDYLSYMRSSTRADMEIEDLMTLLTSLRLNSQTKGSTQQFILDWLDKIRIYEGMTPPTAHFPDIMKKAMLQNALNGLKVFRDVKTTEQLEVAKGNGPLSYQAYVSLIQQVAAGYDKTTEPIVRRPPTAPRQANMTEYEAIDWYEGDDNGEPDPDDSGDYFGSMSINATQQMQKKSTGNFRKRPSLPKAVWDVLSRSDQMAWDSISDQAKFKIIFAYKDHIAKNDNVQRDRRTAQVHDSTGSDDSRSTDNEAFQDAHQDQVDEFLDSALLIQAAAQKSSFAPSDLRRVLSNKNPRKKPPNVNTEVSVHEVIYHVSNHRGSADDRRSLIDRGANGGLAGSNMRIIATTDRHVDISGIDNHQMTNLKIVTAGGVVPTQRGEVIGIFHQYASVPQGRSIHSSVQLESFGIKVDDRSKVLNAGTQTLMTPEGYVLPLDFKNGLPYLPIRPFTDDEWQDLPHVVFTSDVDWNPSEVDCKISDDDLWYDAIPDDPEQENFFDVFDEVGNHRAAIAVDTHAFRSDMRNEMQVAAMRTTPTPRTYEKYRDHFLRASTDVIKRTFDATTQFARSGWITGKIYDTHRAPFPALNVVRRNEAVATDTFFCDTPAVDCGFTDAQFFVGVDSRYVEVYGMKRSAHFIKVLWDTIRKYGAMDVLVSDRAKLEISKKIQDVLRYLCIKDRQSEPHQQHQNPAERRYKELKFNVQRIMNMSGAPPYTWLLCMEYACFVMNRMALGSLDWRTPHERLLGQTPDISMVYRFKFYDRVYFKRVDSRGEDSDASDESAGRFVGFSETVGHAMTYKVLDEITNKILYRSRIRLATLAPNRQLDDEAPAGDKDNNDDSVGDKDQTMTDDGVDEDDEEDGSNGDPIPDDGEEVTNEFDPGGHAGGMAIIDPNDLIGRSYLSQPAEDGQRMRLRIVEVLDQDEEERLQDPLITKFRATNGQQTYEEIVTYNQLLNHLDDDDGKEGLWHFKRISGHQGPLMPSDERYSGSRWNVRVEWENGEVTYEPLAIIKKSDPVSLAIYARDNQLLHLDGWKSLKSLADRQERTLRLANQAKLHASRNRVVHKFGVQVPQNHNQAIRIDEGNGNHLWREAEETELKQIDEYDVFTDLGFKADPPKDYKKIRVHMVYDIKHDLRRKARLVADGNLTQVPSESVYSSVVSLRGLRLTIFLAELNGLELWCTDIGNAYLEAYTDEKIYIVAGNEFGAREGHTLLIHKALYGLRSSGARWWERFSEVLLDMEFFPSKAENDIWMRDRGDHYEYLARYVDDLAIASRNPGAITEELQSKYKFKLKGTGPISYHLGCDFYRDSTGTLCMAPNRYIDRMINIYEQIFGCKPKTNVSSPLERGDHPELDITDELSPDGIKQYQSLIGAAQWLISLGRLDIATAIMTMSSFRVAPRQGHLARMQRIYGYVAKMRHGAIRFRVGVPDYSDIPIPDNNWAKTIYGDVIEEIPYDAPRPLGPEVIMTTYVDANLCHDMTTGRAVTGILHLLNQTPVDFYTKKQGTVETATYGSEYVAARTATEQVIDLLLSLRYLGVRIIGGTYMFGDNRTVVDSSMNIASRLHKRHIILSYHRVREAIAAGVVYFIHLPGALNPADILSKAWGYQQVWVMLKALLFWEGDTMDIE